MTEQRLGSDQPSPAGQEDASWVETAVADYSKEHQAKELLGYSAIAEEPSASPAA